MCILYGCDNVIIYVNKISQYNVKFCVYIFLFSQTDLYIHDMCTYISYALNVSILSLFKSGCFYL